MDATYDAIIVGAGPAGATAAILLAHAGWRVVIVEKQTFPRRKVCGECIAPANIPLIEALGIGPEFWRLAGPPLRQVALLQGTRAIRADFPRYENEVHPWGVALSREYLDTLLLKEAARAGATVLQPWTARGLEGGPGQFRCTLVRAGTKTPVALNAPTLILAHGSWDPGLPQAGQKPPAHRPSDLFAFKANYRLSSVEAGLLPVLSFRGGYGGMVLADHGKTVLAFCLRRDLLQRCRRESAGGAGAAALAYVERECPAVRPVLRNAVQEDNWLAVGPLRPGARVKTRPGIFLIGNAAGEAHPIIGEGISMALQSAWLLARLLAPHRADMQNRDLQRALWRGYVLAWQQQFAARMRIAAIFAHLAMRPGLLGAGLPLLQRHPWLLTQAARMSGKVSAEPAAALAALQGLRGALAQQLPGLNESADYSAYPDDSTRSRSV